ncbi:hypothetical protein MFUM_980022 [Methylacidiphilum fumariolicum SolV]|uniref:Uncharacterized protein n=2 Tax=Candidatus Methylacidiphilum fumarolicum TaxID=591154 RepID=I0K1I5_METFB|nr:conserved protein of unknown function [Candidatus Methylacidiphilum fumarolicum]CCG93354.1 hypothetical protein MFUM_980022 [Methylacidiphilum fumariolicum SolV]
MAENLKRSLSSSAEGTDFRPGMEVSHGKLKRSLSSSAEGTIRTDNHKIQ